MRAFGRINHRRRWPLLTALMWMGVAGLIAWGLWQGYLVRKMVLARADLQMHHHAGHPGKHRPQSAGLSENPGSAPVIQRVFLSTHGESPWGAAPHTPHHWQVIAVLSPGVIHQTNLSLDLAREDLRHGNILTARTLLNEALVKLRGFAEPQSSTIRHILSRLNRRTLLSGGVIPNDPLTRVVPVAAGESLDYLAYLYRITPHLLQHINPGVQARNLRPGTGIKVILGPFDARILLRYNRLDVVDRGIFITSMPIRMADLLPIPPGRYRLQIGGETEFPNPLGHGHGYRITLVKIGRAAGGISPHSTVIITTPPTTVGEIEVSQRPMRRLFELLSPEFSRVEILR
ncbi:MAG: LysM peptidoglycan-binding domain-containing protein [Phycisphaerae bacterium]|nr:LysM peptidoglycan-binding domain-containing protein [Phycisphaerae bacterium]